MKIGRIMMNDFDRDLKEEMFEAVGYVCGMGSGKRADAAHHIVPNTEINRKRWPLYLQSPMNMMPVNNGFHTTQPLPGKPSALVLDVIERWLQRLKRGEE